MPQLSTTRECDVLIIGGGPTGVGASVAAARQGMSTLLIEGTNQLGGMGSNGLVPIQQWSSCDVNGGIISEIWAEMDALGLSWKREGHGFWFNPIGLALIEQQLVVDAGVRILFHARAEGVKVEDGILQGVYLASKGGREYVRAKVVIDATGDGDIAAWAGVPYDKGRSGDGVLQAVSLNFVLSHIDESRVPDRKELLPRIKQAIASGELAFAPYESLWFGMPIPIFPPGTRFFQLDFAMGIDSSDPDSLSEGEVICHARMLAAWRFLRKHVAGFENSVPLKLATYLGVRESRRIHGAYTLCEDDIIHGRKFPDGICRTAWYMDLHDGSVHSPEYRRSNAPPEGDTYEIPYRCLLPLQVEQLLMAGRCISATRPAHGSARTQATCMNMGQAAGTAAALCITRNITPRQMNGEDVRQSLIAQGMVF